MKITFSDDDQASNGRATFNPLPAGEYVAELADVRPETSRNGTEMWRLDWRVLEGPYAGRVMIDRLVFTEKAKPRVRILLGACGWATDHASYDLAPDNILGSKCLVSVTVEAYDRDGETREGNKVLFDGYRKIDDGPVRPAKGKAEDDDLPF